MEPSQRKGLQGEEEQQGLLEGKRSYRPGLGNAYPLLIRGAERIAPTTHLSRKGRVRLRAPFRPREPAGRPRVPHALQAQPPYNLNNGLGTFPGSFVRSHTPT